MKKKDLYCKDFRDLTMEENYSLNGGGFAFDVGRLIRFLVIGAGGGVNTANAIGDAIYNYVQ